MDISYRCRQCGAKLRLSGVEDEDEIGRKHCDICGSNDNFQMVCIGEFKKSQQDIDKNCADFLKSLWQRLKK
ncbi:MAG: hypothetical protein U9P90_00950 [Patescibacteria group bacterium]|nr:hypothetical protein [Patescibacteria group bacterium]